MEKKPLVVLTGPTAVGKTKLSIELAKAIEGEIISADSMQVYKYMDIGSAKITPQEMQGVPHHLIDVLEPTEDFNVVIFKQKCAECMEGIYERGHIPILTGGTGFYIQAVLRDIDFTENEENTEYRASLEALAAEKGAEALHDMLREVDPESAETIHANNIKRTIRALEYHHLTGEKISEHNEQEKEKQSAYRSCYFVLTDDRERLYERIDLRVDEMINAGLVEEVKALREKGCHKGQVSMQGLGYKEILSFLEGEISLEEAVYLIKRDTRHFAKRQLTWFRREKDVIWIDKKEFLYDDKKILSYMKDRLISEGICQDNRKDIEMEEMRNMYAGMGISNAVFEYGEEIVKKLKERFEEIDQNAEYNQLKVLKAMQEHQVSEACLLGTTGYGYNDLGRDTLEQVYASVFHTEDALVRPQITCGTHALALALMSNLRPGDELLSPVGKPYDTLEEVIGIRPSKGSLAEYGVTYRQVNLKEDGSFDWDGIAGAINERTRLVTIQRSKGYQTRPTLSVKRIGELIAFIKKIKPDVICMVDNCYGEFVELSEPSDVGADMVVGSLIKNPGGGLAPIGGYIAGKKECVENAAYRLTSPGLGKEVGASLGILTQFYQGLFLAPTVTAGALKGAIFAANVYENLDFAVIPNGTESRHDIIQAVTFGTPEGVIAFCEGIQAAAPVDSHVTPEPWDMPGYDSKVIMAAGAFVSGSSIELSADGPIKPPYAVYFQGGLTWQHARFGIMKSLQALLDKKVLTEADVEKAKEKLRKSAK